MKELSWDEFEQVELRVGTVTAVEEFPEARRPAWKLWIDFGEDIGKRKSSAQITDLYDADSLLGRQVVAVVNFPRKQIGPFMSECLVTGFYQPDGAIVLAVPERPVQNGAKLG
ncbi:MAG: tRNA-binding protein [Pseudomonadales bacterium]|jgi:tRNA-binding protein|nr:tRNA-binding protein [Pseudomonadales bacterium]RPG44669.1 MAG: tRNA-binding protein [Gammaproteobacteria bacterium TMED163]HAO87830.1 tRNA-binding protein [Gammaproteobacteria bacterium]MCH1600514.1 tRNA-binding protein [Pseudomonadales bacterium]HAR91221.1 tRNA-binding protein [Gammaproteobacteria bacterium]|tara:strand:- start:358 stop:696 length:339 start_codon:yes stop_codon:yes gene_type:complete